MISYDENEIEIVKKGIVAIQERPYVLEVINRGKEE